MEKIQLVLINIFTISNSNWFPFKRNDTRLMYRMTTIFVSKCCCVSVCTCFRPRPAPCCTAGQGACSWGAYHWCRRRGSRLWGEAPLPHHTLNDKHTSVTSTDNKREKKTLTMLRIFYKPDSSRWCSCWLPVNEVWLRISDMRAELRAFPARRLIPDMGSAWSCAGTFLDEYRDTIILR